MSYFLALVAFGDIGGTCFSGIHPLPRMQEKRLCKGTGMRVPTPKTDLWVSFISVALLGASTVIGADSTHHLEAWAFWGGLAGLVFMGAWHSLAFVANSSRPQPAEGTVNVDNRGGAYIGGDNHGTQQVFQGPVTITTVTDVPEYPGREVLPSTLTVDRLVGNFDGKTELQASVLVKPFVGKWLRVRGEVSSVADFGDRTFSVYLRPETERKISITPSVHCIFNSEWETRLHAISRKDWITVIGILHGVSLFSVTMTNCEIER